MIRNFIYFLILTVLCSTCSRDEVASDTSGETSEKNELIEKTSFATVSHYLESGIMQYLTNDTLVNPVKEMEVRIPYLIYYAIDSITIEPFLNAAIDFEIAQLKSVCNGKKHVNFMIVRNLDVAQKKTIEICYKGQLRTKSVNHLIKEIQQFNQKLFLDKTIKNDNLSACLDKVCLPHKQKSRNNEIIKILNQTGFNKTQSQVVKEFDLSQLYIYYPVVHPVFFKSILNSEKNTTPFSDIYFSKFLHIKSHGHIDYAMTVLLDHQLKTRKKKQESILAKKSFENLKISKKVAGMEQILIKEAKDFFSMKIDMSNDKKQDKNENEKVKNEKEEKSNKKNEGEVKGNKFGLLDQSDPCGLGDKKEPNGGLGEQNIEGLGAGNIYLGNQIGITPNMFYEILTNEENEEKKKSTKSIQEDEGKSPDYRFVFLEACDAGLGRTRWPIKSEYILDKVSGIYSPDGLLFYRNIDFDTFFNIMARNDIPSMNSALLQRLLSAATSHVKYKVIKDQDIRMEYIQKYDKVINELKKRN